MKKLVFTICALFSTCFVNAEDDMLGIVPFVAPSNETIAYDEDEEAFTSTNSFDVNLVYSKNYIACDFKFYLPSGMFAFVDESVQPGEILPVKKSGAPYHDTTIGKTESDIKGYDCYRVMAYHNSSSPKAFNNDESGKSLFKIYYGTKGIAEGIYPIYVKDVKLTISTTSSVSVDGISTSYVKVGSPKDATLAVTGFVPSFVTSALNNETAITTLDLTAATTINGEFALMDSRSLILPEKDVTVKRGFYIRNIPAGYSTLCLPFSYTCDDIELFTFGGLKDGKTLVLTPPDDADGEVNANTPVIFKATNAGTLELATSRPFKLSASTSLTVEKDGVSLVGTYAKLSAPKGSYVLQSQNDMEAFYKVGSTQPSVLANRCYLTSAAGEVKAFAFPGCPTAIDGIEADANESAIYDIAGRKVSKADKGIYIVDGKKVVK